jgi:hypothetical protein
LFMNISCLVELNPEEFWDEFGLTT